VRALPWLRIQDAGTGRRADAIIARRNGKNPQRPDCARRTLPEMLYSMIGSD
jgi:hypothetical protein